MAEIMATLTLREPATRAEIATMFVKFLDAYMPQNETTENTAETE